MHYYFCILYIDQIINKLIQDIVSDPQTETETTVLLQTGNLIYHIFISIISDPILFSYYFLQSSPSTDGFNLCHFNEFAVKYM